jgi:uncharacterized protein YdhG (YjbR/CyaY superfamily)
MKNMKEYSDIDAYIADAPAEVQPVLQKIRQTVQAVAPQAEEAMRYGLPTFRLNGNLIHFGAFKTHIGVYPAPRAIEAFHKELSPYEGGKGTIRFPLDKPIPYDLIRKIVEFRVSELSTKK